MCSDSYTFKQSDSAFATLAKRNTLREVHRQHDVLGDRQRRQQLKKLKDKADVATAPEGEFVFR